MEQNKRSSVHIGFSDEPAMWITLLMAGVALAVAFGVPVSPEQRQAIQTFAEAGAGVLILGGFAIRQSVTPVAKAERRKGEAVRAVAVAHADHLTEPIADAKYATKERLNNEIQAVTGWARQRDEEVAELRRVVDGIASEHATRGHVTDAMRLHIQEQHQPPRGRAATRAR